MYVLLHQEETPGNVRLREEEYETTVLRRREYGIP